MPTVFDDPDTFKTTTLTREWDGDNWEIVMSLRAPKGSYIESLIRQDSKGTLVGRVVRVYQNGDLLDGVYSLPDWAVPGTIFKAVVNGSPVTLTLDSTIQTRIVGLQDELGDKHNFSYVQTSEHEDK